MLYSKIHRAVVSDANLNYQGSITLDEELIKAAKLLEGQKVDVVNLCNGERFTTYVITGKPGSGEVCLNGAAARKVAIGDKVIIIAYASFEYEEAVLFCPQIVFVDDNNHIVCIRNEKKI